MEKPEISIIIPCYRKAHMLPAALDSIAADRALRAEVIVIDDGSDDRLAAAAVCAGRPGVRFLQRERNGGASAARNVGIAEARADMLGFLDADDVAGVGMFSAMVRALRRHPAWGVAACGCVFADTNLRPTSVGSEPPPTGEQFGELARRNPYSMTVVVRRVLFDRVGVFDETLRACEDWDLWLRIARTGAIFGRVGRVRFLYRVTPGSLTHDVALMRAGTLEVLARASRPDPRVHDPLPAYAAGIARDPAAERFHLAGILGAALATGDGHTAAELLAELGPGGLAHAEARNLYHHAARRVCLLDGDPAAVLSACWKSVTALAASPLPDPAARLLPLVASALGGGTEAEAWRLAYHRIVRTPPISWLMRLRRRAFRLGDPL